MECVPFVIGSALSGQTVKDQEIAFLLGTGSSGKSTVLTLTKITIECYFMELQSSSFSQNNAKMDNHEHLFELSTNSSHVGKRNIRN